MPTLTTASTTPTTSDVLVTATFSAPVTGVTPSDFNNGSPFPVEAGVTYAVSGGPTEWVLTVSVDQNPRVSKPFTFGMSGNSGSISPTNLDAPATLSLT